MFAIIDVNYSCRVWQKVIQNILNNNETEALREKTIVEERQRALEKERKETNTAWIPKQFIRVADDFYVHKSMKSLRYALKCHGRVLIIFLVLRFNINNATL